MRNLAEDIRLGIGLVPQTWTRTFEVGVDSAERLHVRKACAIGTALLASGDPAADPYHKDHYKLYGFEYTDTTAFEDYVTRVYPVLARKEHCPVCRTETSILDIVYSHLGEPHHHWNREAIADWLDTIEPPKGPSSFQLGKRLLSFVGYGSME